MQMQMAGTSNSGIAGWCAVAMDGGGERSLHSLRRGDRVLCDSASGQTAAVRCVVRCSAAAAAAAAADANDGGGNRGAIEASGVTLVRVRGLCSTPLFPKIRSRTASRFWVHPCDCVDLTSSARHARSDAVFNVVLDGGAREMAVAGEQCMTLRGDSMAVQRLQRAHPEAWKAGLIELPLFAQCAPPLLSGL